MLLVMMHITGNEHGRPLAGWKDWAKALFGLAILGAIFALPMSLPLWIVGGDDLRRSSSVRATASATESRRRR